MELIAATGGGLARAELQREPVVEENLVAEVVHLLENEGVVQNNDVKSTPSLDV